MPKDAVSRTANVGTVGMNGEKMVEKYSRHYNLLLLCLDYFTFIIKINASFVLHLKFIAAIFLRHNIYKIITHMIILHHVIL